MHYISNLFYFGTTLRIFRMVLPSTIRSLRLYIQHQVYVIQVLWLLASGNEMELASLKTPDDGRKDRTKHAKCCSKIK